MKTYRCFFCKKDDLSSGLLVEKVGHLACWSCYRKYKESRKKPAGRPLVFKCYFCDHVVSSGLLEKKVAPEMICRPCYSNRDALWQFTEKIPMSVSKRQVPVYTREKKSHAPESTPERKKCFLCHKRNAYLLVKHVAPEKICRACYNNNKHKPANQFPEKAPVPVRKTRISSLKRKPVDATPESSKAVIVPAIEEPKSFPRSGCKHYWILENATSQVSNGVCKLCGEKRDFPNYLSGCLRSGDPEPGEYLDPLSRLLLHEFNRTDGRNITITEHNVRGSQGAY